ncbi:hypothetical protein ANCDUO_01081 [Ancylostoma duodenale]|uniref:Uncharacterized protein n=1 Tax=Ancylostoma duodenale TaxID=51022 RepID=A0A0C2HAA2_9BILA|nr:hypothetical protein ANCDUO_01081 [Ancylostoma duodenale]
MQAVIARNNDPIIDQMMRALLSKYRERTTKDIADYVEAEKRGRSLLISGIDESTASQPLKSRQTDLEKKVCNILDALDVDCTPVEVYRLGKRDDRRSRLLKVVLPSKTVHCAC